MFDLKHVANNMFIFNSFVFSKNSLSINWFSISLIDFLQSEKEMKFAKIKKSQKILCISYIKK